MSFTFSFKMAAAVFVSLSAIVLSAVPAHSQTEQTQAASSITGSYDFSWQAQNRDGIIDLSGKVPSESLQRFLLIRAGEGGSETLTIGRGAPETFISSSIAGLDALKKLDSGRFYFADGIWTLEGVAPSEEEKVSILAVLSLAVDTGDWEIAVDVAPATPSETVAPIADTEEVTSQEAQASEAEAVLESTSRAGASQAVASEETTEEAATETAQPVAEKESQTPVKSTDSPTDSPYRFDALRADGGMISLAGNLPARAFATYLSKVAGDASTEFIQIQPDAPRQFRINILTGIKGLARLRSGLLSYKNDQWTLVGDALNEQIRDEVQEAVLGLEGGDGWVLDIATVPAVEICKLFLDNFSRTKTILFAPASAQLTAESRQNLVELAQSLNRCASAPIYVSGHTDSDGPAEDNMALSVARAEAVVEALLEAGVEDSRLYAIGYGETLPVATNDTRAGKAQNRRIVFELGQE